MAAPRALRPFRVRQYRVLVSALTLSLFGEGVWLVAIVWQVIAVGGSPVDLSLVATGASAGLIAAVLFGGVVADRVPQRRILIAVESTKTVIVALTAAVTLTGHLALWHLVVLSIVLGAAGGFFYPAYSALLPSVLPADDLLAANGVEGVLRPAVLYAGGPAVASAVIAAASPGLAFAVVAGSQLLAVTGLAFLEPTPLRRGGSDVALAAEASTDGPAFAAEHGAAAPGRPAGETSSATRPGGPTAVRGVFADLGAGFRYMGRTPWLLGTLLFASLLILVIMGPIEVLLPFAVRDQTGGGPGAFAVVLAAYGVGGVVGSIVVASRPLPRRYLTVMVLLWGAGSLPLVVIGFTSQLWVMAVAVFVVGVTAAAATVIWGTLLQRRVPPEMLGRVSSLDFFVSLAFMPVSMAIAGPVGEAIGIAPAFVVAGAVPVVIAVVAIIWARMPSDELAHPLDLKPA
ncbi:MAG: MFS transporter [Herbiconiux sp.]|uniref:MFS transporter n=1 Tax=Herbiconiux sp. TaxID=1871186 RepID=UPI00121EB5EC|nr:MFS transporter [Herbiconiux sp.]TAJ46770.1 MAG: MFS transporter [Herbiconiux sp.]